jgi:glutamate 5-kinase
LLVAAKISEVFFFINHNRFIFSYKYVTLRVDFFERCFCMENNIFKDKKRIIIKIGSNSLTHPDTGHPDLVKIEKLVREISDLRNQGKDVCLVSSGAVAFGRLRMGFSKKPNSLPEKQALAAVGQAGLMSIYSRLFSEYNERCGQVLMTKNTIIDNVSRINALNTFESLFKMGVIPIVNENDTISTYEMKFGDNDTLSAMVTSLTGADLLILLSDINGLYDSDPRKNPGAELIKSVSVIDENIEGMASDTPGSDIGTGGMATKIRAAKIATASGADMIIANGRDVSVIHEILDNDFVGTHFLANEDYNFDLIDYLSDNLI